MLFVNRQVPTTTIVDKFSVEGVFYEVHSDGDCLVTLLDGGYLQLKGESLARIAKVGSRATADKVETTAPLGCVPIDSYLKVEPAVTESASANETAEKLRRAISPVAEGSGWTCVLTKPGQSAITHVYASRSLARAASPSTQIGEQGRLA